MSMNYGEIAGIYSRPIAVMVIGAVLLILGIVSVIFGVLMLTDVLNQFLTDVTDKYPELKIVLEYGSIIFTTGGLINILLGAGFILTWKAAWYVSIIAFMACIVASLAFIILSDVTISTTILIATVVVIAISLLMLLCMFRISTKSYFLD